MRLVIVLFVCLFMVTTTTTTATPINFFSSLGSRIKTLFAGSAAKQSASQIAMQMNSLLFPPQDSANCKIQWLQKAATECTLYLTAKKQIMPGGNPWTLADCIQIKTYLSPLIMAFHSQQGQSFGVQQCSNLDLPGYPGYQPFNGRFMPSPALQPYPTGVGYPSPQPGFYPPQYG